jgi:hypothetical protein
MGSAEMCRRRGDCKTDSRPPPLRCKERTVTPRIESDTMKRTNLTIAEPCHENWDTMTGDQRGRFCSSCDKSVHHLTEMSPREATSLLRSQPADGLCIRYEVDEAGDPVVGRRRVLATSPLSQQLGATALVGRATMFAAGLASMLAAGVATAGPPAPMLMGEPIPLEIMGGLDAWSEEPKPGDRAESPTTGPVETTLEQQECEASGRLDCYGIELHEVEFIPTIEIDRPQLMGRMPAPEFRQKW